MKLYINGEVIEDTLPYGIFALPDIGGAGKTYFGKLLKSLQAKQSIQAAVVTYQNDFEEEDYLRLLDRVASRTTIIFIDRLDLYLTDMIAKKIVFLSKNHKIFLDLKDWDITHIFLPKSTKLKRLENGVEISYVSYDI